MLLRLLLQFDVVHDIAVASDRLLSFSSSTRCPSVGKHVLLNLVPLTDHMRSMIIKPIDLMDSCQT